MGFIPAPTDERAVDIEFLKSGLQPDRASMSSRADRWYYMVCQTRAASSGRNAQRQQLPAWKPAPILKLNLLAFPAFGKIIPLVVWCCSMRAVGQYDTERLTLWLKTRDPSLSWTSPAADRHAVGDLVDMHSYPGPDSPPPECGGTRLWRFRRTGLQMKHHSWST